MASPACCQRPPVTVDYKTQGRWDEFAGLKTYIVGPENATKAIIDIYDIFGMWPQTLQGADFISALTGALVIVPDFFEGSPAGIDWFPPDTPEKQKLVGEFVQTKAGFDKNVPALIRVRKALSDRYPAVDDHVGVFGLCWGGKIGILASGADNKGPGRRFTVCGTAHPGRLDIKDGEPLTAPYILLASKDEPAEAVEEYRALLSHRGNIGEVETYLDMHHGWMGARADLENANNVKEYTRGYEQIAAFFNKHL